MKRDRFALGYLVTAGFGPVIVLVIALIIATVACTPKGGFDSWIARQPYTVKHQPVPCAVFPRNCGGTAQTDVLNRIIYLDDAAIAEEQAHAPGVDVYTFVWYHEWAHVADYAVGFVFGIGDLQFEHAAQCGAQLVLGYTYDFRRPAIYGPCSDADLARTRWIWTARGII